MNLIAMSRIYENYFSLPKESAIINIYNIIMTSSNMKFEIDTKSDANTYGLYNYKKLQTNII